MLLSSILAQQLVIVVAAVEIWLGQSLEWISWNYWKFFLSFGSLDNN